MQRESTELQGTEGTKGTDYKKIISDNATDILIVPNWPSQFWFTVLQDLLLTEAFIIPPNANN